MPLSAPADSTSSVTAAIRIYLDSRFSEERAQIDGWKTRNYGTAYLSFLQHHLLIVICTQHLSIQINARRIHTVHTPDGHPFTWKEVVEWAGIKWKAFAEIRTFWKCAEEMLMLLRQDYASGGQIQPLMQRVDASVTDCSRSWTSYSLKTLLRSTPLWIRSLFKCTGFVTLYQLIGRKWVDSLIMEGHPLKTGMEDSVIHCRPHLKALSMQGDLKYRKPVIACTIAVPVNICLLLKSLFENVVDVTYIFNPNCNVYRITSCNIQAYIAQNSAVRELI